MPTTNIFTNAKVVPAKQTKAKVEAPQVEIPGLEKYAAICAAEKAIKALKETYKATVETHMIDQFVIDGSRIKKRPENFKGKEGKATASCELRKRSSASALSDEEKMLCAQFGIKTEEVSDIVETFIINPAYKDDQETLEKVAKALSKVKDLPSDFIQLQQGSCKTVVTEESLDQVFTLPDQVVRQLITVVGTLAVKPTTKATAAECLKVLADTIAAEDEEGDE